MIFKRFFKSSLRGITYALGLTVLLQTMPVQATEIEDRIAANQAMEVESNQWKNWPAGPIVNVSTFRDCFARACNIS